MRRLIKVLSILLVILAMMFIFVQMEIGSAKESITVDPEASFVVIVPGASVRGGKPSHVLKDRMDIAIELYKLGLVEKVLASGDGGGWDYNEMIVMQEYFLSNDVLSEDLFIDHAGFDSYDTIYRAKQVFGVQRGIVVSQKFHLPRLLYIARSMNMELKGVSANKRTYKHYGWFVARESFANVKALIETFFRVKSTYGGEEIDITGNGEITHFTTEN